MGEWGGRLIMESASVRGHETKGGMGFVVVKCYHAEKTGVD